MTRASLLAFVGVALIPLMPLMPHSASAQTFRRFVACDNCISDYYYVDQPGGFFPQDWNCESSTYDGHIGTDFSLRNGNAAIEDGNDITAAAAGTVVSTEDGYFDHCTQCGGANCGYDFGNGFANQVYIDHGGYFAMYGHMRTGSIVVQPGDTVTCGQVIGQIGSAGCSTGAHVHFEPRSASTEIYVDPYEGACSPTPTSLWVAQGAHRTLPATTCDGSPPTPTCPAATYPIWTCSTDLTSRRRCIDGVDTTEACAAGCTVMASGTDDICALPPDADADGSRADVDCDDASNAIHPGAIDSCGDAIDQDCSGADALCPVAGTGGTGGAAGMLGTAGTAAASGAAGVAAAGGSLNAGMTGSPIGVAGEAIAMMTGGASAGAPGSAGVAPGQAGAFATTSPRNREPAGCSATDPSRSPRSPTPSWLALTALLYSLRSLVSPRRPRSPAAR